MANVQWIGNSFWITIQIIVFKEDTRLGKEIPLNRKLIRNFKNQTFKNNEDINITIYESSGNVKLKTN